jgi:hypothetical protein
MQEPIFDQAALDEIFFDVESVQWSSMCHCRGDADDVPDLLYRYLGGVGDDVEKAEGTLWDALQYQGSIFEPSSHATRFIVRALDRSDHADHQVRLATWVAAMARGYTMTEGQGLLRWVAEDDPERPEVEAQYERELGWVKEVQTEAWKARDRLLALLESASDRRLLMKVSYALVGLLLEGAAGAPKKGLVEDTGVTVSELAMVRARQSTDPVSRSGMIATMGSLQKLVTENTRRLRELLAATEEPGPRAIAALYLAYVTQDEEIADALTDALSKREHHGEWLPQPWPWFSGHLRFHLIDALCLDGFSDEAFERALDPILDVLRNQLSPYTFEHDLAPVLARVFGDLVISDATRREDLEPRVLRVLDAVFANPGIWPNNIGNVGLALRPFGLKNNRDFWARLLGHQEIGREKKRSNRWWWPFRER